MITSFVADRYLSNETLYAGKWKLVRWSIFRNLSFVSLGLYVALVPFRAMAGGTSYETQIAGFIYASLSTFIVGEFAGRGPANIAAERKMRVCKSSDYNDLRTATNDRAAFDAFHRRCKFVEFSVDTRHVHGTAYLSKGYCETIKNAFDAMLAEQINNVPSVEQGDVVTLEYKGARYRGTQRALAHRAQLRATCAEDGSLRVSASR